jgi:hypothetical protein
LLFTTLVLACDPGPLRGKKDSSSWQRARNTYPIPVIALTQLGLLSGSYPIKPVDLVTNIMKVREPMNQ